MSGGVGVLVGVCQGGVSGGVGVLVGGLGCVRGCVGAPSNPSSISAHTSLYQCAQVGSFNALRLRCKDSSMEGTLEKTLSFSPVSACDYRCWRVIVGGGGG